jgi:DHA1 family tetracycline resistance protein-like MFS transporter
MNSGPKPARSPLLFIFLTVFIDLLGFGIVIPLLPTYSKAYGASERDLGLLFTCFSGMQFLFAPMWGRLSDRIGRRPVLIGGLVGTSLSYVLFANAHGMAMLYVSRLLAGFFAANVAVAFAYIGDVTKPEERAKGMGLVGAAFGLGFTFGPPVGGIMSTWSLALPGYAAAGLSIAAAIFGWLRLPEPPVHASEASRDFHATDVRGALSQGRTGTLVVLNFLAIFAFTAFESMFIRFGFTLFPTVFHLPAAVSEWKLDDIIRGGRQAGYYMFYIGIISALIQGGLIRRLVPKFGETRLVIAGPLFLGLALAIIGVASSWWMVLAGCALLPLGFGLSNPAIAGLMSRAAPANRQGAYLGVSQSAASLARAVGPYVAGWCFAISPRAPFLVAACVVCGAALIATVYRARFGATFTGAASAAPVTFAE